MKLVITTLHHWSFALNSFYITCGNDSSLPHELPKGGPDSRFLKEINSGSFLVKTSGQNTETHFVPTLKPNTNEGRPLSYFATVAFTPNHHWTLARNC